MSKYAVSLLALASIANAASLGDVKHVIMVMFENRSFNHYFGTFPGVRGFADPNVKFNTATNKSAWYQSLKGVTTEAEYLLPFYLNSEGGAEGFNKSQCLCAGANNWIPTQQIFQAGLENEGVMDQWAIVDTPQAWGYFKREDLPYHFALAESYALADHYHAAITSNTDPNRWYWQSGSIGVPGGPQAPNSGGIILDDQQANLCSGPDLDCVPLHWSAYAQIMDEAGVDWMSFQNSYNWATNSGLFYFSAFQEAAVNSSLYKRGLNFDGPNGLDAYIERAANGTLPEVSYMFPPGALQEHPPYTPVDASWYLNQVVSAAINGPNYNETIILVNYDEAGGWGDPHLPIISPEGTAGEWFQDPYNEVGYTFSGPGPRIPLYIVSPFTRGGTVFTERADHSSIIMFLEEYLTARGHKNVVTPELDDWRRQHMSNLVNVFDFENPDYSIPNLPEPPMPLKDDDGNIIGLYSGFCAIEWPGSCSGSEYVPDIPYGTQTEENSLVYEDGYKLMRGYLTEGRWLVFESNGYALSNPANDKKQFEATAATGGHEALAQRWVAHSLNEEGTLFTITSAVDGTYLSQHNSLSTSASGAETYNVTYIGNSQYVLQKENGDYTNIGPDGVLAFVSKPTPYKIWSVTYNK
ncbi:Phosphatidylcholine-hydrolyzing phospholipase C [Hyphodiscus hymeniophilus]|uniref:Phosphatidylcholine-hydrolyzing phospholipase C n=1 Tax=Hyphodiscus hymeniophilus TaxID=353542 RepID=A0A9P7AV91_9HELO|nr:Phosphatidylcholine-hydrolyzing phospholipase C [Hyphodiscus hymeniophilus]